MVNLNTKYEVPGTMGGSQKLNNGYITLKTPQFGGICFISGLKLAAVSLCIQFEVPCQS